ncbi:hypothetical protein MUP77_22655 [Candidatus Bathyarchaeota archaeon]|nr:hypothetical protein [Candidatus Bathyarchaeota archaeon]
MRMKDVKEYTKKALSLARLIETKLIQKYRNNAKTVLKSPSIEKSLNMILNLETITDINSLMEQLNK